MKKKGYPLIRRYEEVGVCTLKPTREMVVSRTYEYDIFTGYSVSQRLILVEDGKENKLFMKNGLGVLNLDGLKAIRDCLDKIIKEKEKGTNK